jgi:hypothetical protein
LEGSEAGRAADESQQQAKGGEVEAHENG